MLRGNVAGSQANSVVFSVAGHAYHFALATSKTLAISRRGVVHRTVADSAARNSFPLASVDLCSGFPEMSDPVEPRWLLLIHQIPPKPNYFRVKVGRRLQRLGAVAIKNSVYVLPKSEQSQEDFEWVVREIVEGGGEASVCEARFVEGLSDAEVEALFNAAREADYLELAGKARRLRSQLPRGKKGEDRDELESAIARFRKHLEE